MKPIVVATLAIALGSATLLAGCKGEEAAAPAPVAEPAMPPAPVEPPPPAEPAVDPAAEPAVDPAVEPAVDPALPDPNAAPAEGETTEEETDAPHSGGDRV